MTQGLQELTPQAMDAALEGILRPRLAETLRIRQAGHCMRVTDLERDLMIRLCGGLRGDVPDATIVVLADEVMRAQAPDLCVSSTKLVELRNPLPNDELRPPLMVFVPNDLRVSAEDSFGVATFEDISISGIYREVISETLALFPAQTRGPIEAAMRELQDEDARWPYADDAAIARFLLTAKCNEFDQDALGAALYEVGLIPDFQLFERPDLVLARLRRNRECVQRVTWSARSERARALELGLSDTVFRRQLGDFFAQSGLANPREWTYQIVKDRSNWPLAFNKWAFEDGGLNPASIFVGNLKLPDLPVVKEADEDPRLAELVGLPVLPISKTGLKKFSVSFQVDPLPSLVTNLSRFVAEVVSRDNGPTGFRRRKAAWKTGQNTATIAFTSIGKVDWEEGWHYVRIYAETADGERVPLVDATGGAIPFSSSDDSSASAPPNQSEPFYVLTEDDVEIEPPQRAVPKDASLMHSLFRAKFAAVTQERDPETVTLSGCSWIERHAKGKTSSADTLEIRLGKEGKAHVHVPSLLVSLEQAFLSNPHQKNRLRLDVNPNGNPCIGNVSFKWPESDEAQRFLSLRETFFASVLRGTEKLILQGSDLLAISNPAMDYAAAYVEWIGALQNRAASQDPGVSRQAFEELNHALTVDTALLILTDYRGRRREAVLLSPTHPLRSIWHVTWAHLAKHWLRLSQVADKEFVIPTRDALLKQLAPMGFPPVIPFGQELGRTAVSVDNLTPFWSIYAATDEADPRGLIGEVCASLGIPESANGGAMIDSEYLATRIQRYLIQHPYVRTLTINAFNAGRASALADVLLLLQKCEPFTDLRYDVRLFVPDPDAPLTGEALTELLSPDSGVTCKEADAFSSPAESHLHPKLRLAIRSIEDFKRNPEEHGAHLSFLFDVFPAEELRASLVKETDDSSFVHGLVQPYTTEYREDAQSITWLRRPLHGVPQAIEGAEEFTDLLGAMSRLISGASASLSRGQSLPNARPVVALNLSAEERAMLHQVHEVSDWVLTLDRNLGIEFFDHRRNSMRPDYLIDHSPDMANAMGYRLAITSRSVAELEALLIPVLDSYGLPHTGKHALVMLDQLRSLSGRLALKLLSSSTQRAEAMGLALSRLFLEHQGVFQNQVVVPLDAHLELYKALKQNALELGDEVSFRRTDLALFDLNPLTREITCRLVEVKCYTQVGDVAAFQQLKGTIAAQISQTEQVLGYHFDPRRHQVDRPDRPVKNRDLAALLEFYLDRAERYGVVMPDAVHEARFFLRHLDEQPYVLNFTRSALVFDFSKPGTEAPDVEEGIEFYRIGRDLIEQLVEAAIVDTDTSASFAKGEHRDISLEITQELVRRRSLAPSIPTFDTAAFISPRRDRTGASDSDDSRGSEYPAPPPPLPVAEPRHESHPAAVMPAVSAKVSMGNKPAVSPQAAVVSLVPDTAKPASPTAEDLPPVQPPAGELSYDILLGATGTSPQFGLIGEVSGRKIALDLNQTHTISLFGVQGGGKSYTLGSIAEMASLPIPGINLLPEPLATVIFHYSPTMDYKPEFTSMVKPNSVEDQVRQLKETYGAEPKALTDVMMLVPSDKVDERKSEYPDIEIRPLQFSASELKASHWKFLMGAVGNQATYLRQLLRIMKAMRDDITLSGLRDGIGASSLPDHLKDLARMRLDLASDYINDAVTLSDVVRPGRLLIVDLRDEFIEKDVALGLFVVLLQLFADAKVDGKSFNKLVVFDEAHKYIDSPDLVTGLIEVVREMRHKGVSILVASQDPPSVPVNLIDLSTQIILHKFNSPQWLKHLQKANASLANLTPERMASLKAGEAFVWSSKATDDSFSKGAVKVHCRPRVTQHGGATKEAVS